MILVTESDEINEVDSGTDSSLFLDQINKVVEVTGPGKDILMKDNEFSSSSSQILRDLKISTEINFEDKNVKKIFMVVGKIDYPATDDSKRYTVHIIVVPISSGPGIQFQAIKYVTFPNKFSQRKMNNIGLNLGTTESSITGEAYTIFNTGMVFYDSPMTKSKRINYH